MRIAIRAATWLLFTVALASKGGITTAYARSTESTVDFSVQVSAMVQEVPPKITLSWLQDSSTLPTSYIVSRKTLGAPCWGPATTLRGSATSFTDTNVTVGAAYEYQVVKRTRHYNGYGYLYAGINVPLTERRGTLLLVVENTYAEALTNELTRLQQDLIGDGWTVKRLDVNRTDSVNHVKKLIRAEYDSDPANVKSVFLFGHVPVPYSGNIVPDGHLPDHQGAWPCDGFYGDMDGIWTDSMVNSTSANDARSRNVPGDGKFDQSTFPGSIRLMVGRVDLANMPGRMTWGGPPTFPSELELLRNYLNKNHRFRHKQFELPRRAFLGDYFGIRDGEAFAASGWRNLASFFGPTNLTHLPNQGTWIPTLNTNACLVAYGCGSGSYTSIGGLGNTGVYRDGITTELVSNDIKTVFALLFGSWLGDWDSEDNLQRAVLALPSYGLACAWSGRPHWFLQHMALGETIGFGARLTQNNTPGGLYQNQVNSCAGQIHIALMGDPTLRLHTLAPPTNLQLATNDAAIDLNWIPSTDAVLGYHVYRGVSASGPFIRLNSTLLTNTAFSDVEAGASSTATYMVRAVALETSASGTYYNPSQAAFVGSDVDAVTGVETPPAATNSPAVSVQPESTNSILSRASARLVDGPATLLTPVGGTNEVKYAEAPALNGDETLLDSSTYSLVESPWVDNSLPSGAIPVAEGNDAWNWISAPPAGNLVHQSRVNPGLHQHFFHSATTRMQINPGDVLYAYVYLDPSNMPTEVMVQWNNGSWDHRAYWGADKISYGVIGTGSRRYMGPLPLSGQWVRLEVPASWVDLEGSAVHGMAFTLFDGMATWDSAGKITQSSSVVVYPTSNSIPGICDLDYTGLRLPKVGDNSLRILTPNLLELKLINTKNRDPARVAQWDFVDSSFQLAAPSASSFTVTVNGQAVTVTSVGFKRRPIYAPLATFDLRIENSLYLELGTSVGENAVVEVKNPGGALWPATTQFITQAHPLRYSPAVHVNQEGYLPAYPKKAIVGYYAGNLGEMTVPGTGFQIVDANTGEKVFLGTLVPRRDIGYTYSPTPYQKVYEADFTTFNVPGQYRLVVPGLGASLPFRIDEGIGLAFARAYALGLYHQRCGTSNVHPHTRFTHDQCHAAPASVPLPASSFPFTWNTISNYSKVVNSDNPPQSAPKLTGASEQLFPFLRQGAVDVSGGHHDAGDYSKYTANSASFIHYLMFAADSLAGVASLDNLGLPESGDGISDVLQIAKWEADFVAKLQDSDGGFYFLVYPKNREYESGVLPEHGDPQVVWPKTTSVTAASVAALAQCASSPLFKQAYPSTAASYMQKAQLGWQFLTNALARYGQSGAYQKITHYTDDYVDKDELAWAACQMYLATGDPAIHQQLLSWFDPANPATWRWGWWHMSQCYGHAIRSYAFALRSGRVSSSSQLNTAFLDKCNAQIAVAAEDVLKWSQQSAYGTSFSDQAKAVRAAGWYFSTDQAFDLAVAYQLNPKSDYLTALIANMNYEGGCNPVNVSFVTGLGWKRQRDIVSQYAPHDRRVLPPSGIPVGNVQGSFGYLGTYEGELQRMCFPNDGAATAPYPFYDRWGDSWNVTAEFVILNSARSLASLGFLAARTAVRTQPWKAGSGSIRIPDSDVPIDSPVTVSLEVPGMDLTSARIVWEARDQEPGFGPTFTFSPRNNGLQWVEAEACWPDGRRVFASAQFRANAPDVVWMNGSPPLGALLGSDGGDAWNWINSTPPPPKGGLAHQSAIASGLHQHYFDHASSTLTIESGDILYAYVFVDPLNPPSAIMLQWNDGSWEHRAYWGANNFSYGVNGTASRRFIGPLPAAGQWVQLQVPANLVNLQGKTIKGMAFTLFNGRATWGAAGRLSPLVTPPAPNFTIAMTSSGPLLRWNSLSNASYLILYTDHLPKDPRALDWRYGVDLTATGSSSSWLDQTARTITQRFYRLERIY